MNILVLNAGSSSQKSCLYRVEGSSLPDQPLDPIWSGSIDWSRRANLGELTVKANGSTLRQEIEADHPAAGIPRLLKTLTEGSTQVLNSLEDISTIGHRVVHGGQHYQDPVLITPEVKAAIQELATLAPAHNPANLAGIQVCETLLPGIAQVAVFDTGFHAQMPAAASTYPGPYTWPEQGIRRYGFHGLSHQYCTERIHHLLADSKQSDPPLEAPPLRILTAHLGNGCSLAAIRGQRSIDTTMGFTPLEGLMMGSRSGSVDPGLLVHLLKQGLPLDELDHLLNRGSGLKGLSGLSSDMRSVLAACDQGDPRAQLAIDVYIHRLRREMGGMIASLEGLDILIFTGGVGENAALIRQRACAGFEFLGLKLDPVLNQPPSHPQSSPADLKSDRRISSPNSSVEIWVIHTEEDWVIAKSCFQLSRQSANTAVNHG